MSSSLFSSRAGGGGGIQRRSLHSATTSDQITSSPLPGPDIDIDPPPKPWPLAQFLAFCFIVFFGFLQLLPPTHLRDPSNPLGGWLPFNSSSSSSSGDISRRNSNLISTHGGEDEMIHVVSWMDCLDLQVLAVLANSTLSSSRYPDRVYFHFFIPEGHEEKISYFKLKVLFPHSNLEILGQKEVKQNLKTVVSGGEYAGPRLHEIAPFLIPSSHPSLSRFIYVSPDIIVKGRIEELFGVDFSTYGIATAEDCTKSLNAYVKFDVLDAIQRSASKPWVSGKPYERTACVPDLNVLLIDARKLGIDLVEAILWWNKVLNIGNERKTQTNPAIVLALYSRYHKLSTTWMVRDSTSFINNEERKIIHYDGPKKVCHELDNGHITESHLGNIWKQHVPSMSDRILGN